MIDLALQHRLPTFSTQKPLTHGGALASYSASFPEMAREIAGYVDKILKGAKPADLPVQQPTKFELVDQPQDREGARPRQCRRRCSPAPTR